jgi:dTDP-4-amino-4,6-dideoxygalactose transaminase
MPNLNAALACAQLEQLRFLENKRKLAKEYQSFFAKQRNKIRTETAETKPVLVDVSGIGNKSERDLF